MSTRRTALVTGASRGIGRAIAARLIASGLAVGVVQRGDPPGIGEAVAVRADLSDAEAAARAVDEVADALGRLDVLVCNAGTILRASALETSPDAFRDVLELNVVSVFAQAQAAARRFLAQRSGGSIVLTGSMTSYQGSVNVAAYSASKGAIALLTKALANEWAPHRIRVNAVAPGWIETEMTAALREDPDRFSEITGRIPAGRWGAPEDVAGAVAFLVSDEARYVHGLMLPVDGGYLGR